jgi:UDP-N-acetylmuramate--alanine ligase
MILLNHQNQDHIFHIIGIGGIGMSAIAQIMHRNGYIIQGSDISDGYNIQNLTKLGIKVFIGHDAANIANADYVILSSAIKDTNPELIAAKEQGKIIVKRHEILSEIMRNKIGVSISGTHGKTTTTSMVANLFEKAHTNPTVITGGIINSKGTNGYVGSGDFMIVEADESDSTFVQIPSQIAVITNIEPEHLDFYGSFENLLKDFRKFITQLPFYGFAVACIDDAETRKLVSEIENKKIVTYGIDSKDANLQAKNIRAGKDNSTFDIYSQNRILRDVILSVSGRHNVLNSLAVVAIAFELGFDDEVIKNALKDFCGVKRRFTKTGEFLGATIVDDYAHHPTEVRATLANAKNFVASTGGKVIGVFQPHRYSRLQNLMSDFSKSFDDADVLYVTDVYSAGEKEIEDVDSVKLISMLIEHGCKSVYGIQNLEDLVSDLKNKTLVNPGDIIVFMGAGDITKWAYECSAIFINN